MKHSLTWSDTHFPSSCYADCKCVTCDQLWTTFLWHKEESKTNTQLHVCNCDDNSAKFIFISPECHNISATLSEYHLENLTPDTKYVITLAGVTKVGVGPGSTVTISTQPEKPFNGMNLCKNTHVALWVKRSVGQHFSTQGCHDISTCVVVFCRFSWN